MAAWQGFSKQFSFGFRKSRTFYAFIKPNIKLVYAKLRWNIAVNARLISLNSKTWRSLKGSKITHSGSSQLNSIKKSSCPWAHKAITRGRHCCLSFAFSVSSPQLTLFACISFSTVRRQVSFGLPIDRFPGDVQCTATLGMADSSILTTWPIQRHLLFFAS